MSVPLVVQDVVDTHLQAVAGRAALQPVMGGKFAQQVGAPPPPPLTNRAESCM